MLSRPLLYLCVAAVALIAAGAVVGVTLATRNSPTQPSAASGKPPVPTDLPGKSGPAIEAAFRDWPTGSIDTLQRLGLQYPTNAIVQYYRGVGLLWAGYPSDAQSALQLAKKLGRDTLVQSRSDNLLHPNYFRSSSGPGYPVFVPIAKSALLLKGSRLQEEGHQQSAEAVFRQAAARDPNDVEAKVAVAVALFDEDNLVPSFSRLGPLTKAYPKAQVVRYYLGLLLAWTSQGQQALVQFKKVADLGATTELGKAAEGFLQKVATGTSSSG